MNHIIVTHYSHLMSGWWTTTSGTAGPIPRKVMFGGLLDSQLINGDDNKQPDELFLKLA
jgi:hypothetical protein